MRKINVHTTTDVIRKQEVHIAIDMDFIPEENVDVVEFIIHIPTKDRRTTRTIRVSPEAFPPF